MNEMDTYQIGETVDLQEITPSIVKDCKTRLAIVVEIYKYFVLCKSIKGGYLECINTREGKKCDFPGYV